MNARLLWLMGGMTLALVLGAGAGVGSELRAADDAAVRAESHLRRELAALIEQAMASAAAGESTATWTERVRPDLERVFDFATMARRSVGPGWRTFTEEERRRTTALFTTLVVTTYASRLATETTPSISYDAAVVLAPGSVEVPTTVTVANARFRVVYRLDAEADGWRITDVVAEGVSLIANYRGQFAPLVQRGGAEGLLAALEAAVSKF